ncbi:MAG: hypothetical protein PUA56_04510 [Bacillales bacterium]|nr:hypothetical protein [Bacillales bacterium]
MKKCPFCNTFMNDDVEQCPNCLKDVSSFQPMPEVAPKNHKTNYFLLMFGFIFSFGGLAASLSQRKNRFDYIKMKETLLADYELNKTDELYDKILRVSANIKTCQLSEVFFYLVVVLGVGLVIYSIVNFIIKKVKKAKAQRGD